MNRTEPWGDLPTSLHDINQRLLTLDLENKRQWYRQQPDPPPVPPDWLGFNGFPPTSSTTTSSTSTSTSTSSSSTTTVPSTCPNCVSASIGATTSGGNAAFPAVNVAMANGSGGVFGNVACSYAGETDTGVRYPSWGPGTPLPISVVAGPSAGNPASDWYCTVSWPWYPEDSSCYEQATYKKTGSTGAAGTYNLNSSPPGCHNLDYPASITLTNCSGTTTTTSTTSSSTTTIACTGTCIWLFSGGDWVRVSATIFNCASMATCTDCDCPKPNYSPGGAVYDNTNCGCGANPTTTTTTTTTSTSSSTTTTVACPGGTGQWIWNCSGGVWLFTTGDGTCSTPGGPPAETTPCVEATTAHFACSDCSWSVT